MTFEIELRPGEQLALPQELIECVGEGYWTVTIERVADPVRSIRDHAAFLGGYASEDEGLYDDFQISIPGR